jgi:uncharacterized protein (TIGR03435 family)
MFFVFFTTCAAFGQTFDAASIKPPSPPGRFVFGRVMPAGPAGGRVAGDPGRVHYPNISLKEMLMTAYDVKGFQISGPQILDTEKFTLDATLPPATTKTQYQKMLQNLLAERFKVTLHRDTKELPAYALTVAKGGPKLTESKSAAAVEGDELPTQSAPVIGPDGYPALPPSMAGHAGLYNMMMPDRYRMIGQQQTMQDLAARLSMQLDRPVVDATGLTGKYDFTLSFHAEQGMMGPYGALPPPPPGVDTGRPETDGVPDIYSAIGSQLGLKLESKKAPVEILVIDHVEKTPTGN